MTNKGLLGLPQGGVAVTSSTPGNPLGAGDPTTTGTLTFSGTMTGGAGGVGAWTQITASMPVDAMIVSVSYYGESGIGGSGLLEIGTGASGSEVVRWVTNSSRDTSLRYFPATPETPWGVYVPSGTRLAARRFRADGGGSNTGANEITVHYVTATTPGTQVQAGWARVAAPNSTAWTEIAATPPVAGGVYVVGYIWQTAFAARLGLGASGSEVATTGYMQGGRSIVNTQNYFLGTAQVGAVVWIPPVFWSAGSRLAAQWQATPGTGYDFYILWRETLA